MIDSVITMYSGNTTLATRSQSVKDSESADSSRLRRHLEVEQSAEISLILAIDSTGVNNGVWLLRDTAWSHDFLSRWWHSDILSGPGKNHNCSDQSTMVHTLLYDNAMNLDEVWDSVEGPIWPLEVRVA